MSKFSSWRSRNLIYKVISVLSGCLVLFFFLQFLITSLGVWPFLSPELMFASSSLEGFRIPE